MISFESDYVEGAREEILEALMRTNMEQLSGYGSDRYTKQAANKIRERFGVPEADVYFLVGGTQTNQLIIDTVLRPYEGVVSARTGHVALHEAGAIEYTGHKVLEIPGHEGRMDAGELDDFIGTFYGDDNHEHMVFPGMAYISYPTEYGTLYSKAELTAIHEVCAARKIPLFIDGARLGYGLMSSKADLTPEELASLCDVFYIGGTKVGALCGEAVVFPKGNAPEHFIHLMKKHGALLAKGRLNGIQFDTLFTDDLYFKIARHADELAERMKEIFLEKGYELYLDSPTNQQFIVLDDHKLKELEKEVAFSFWEKKDESRTVVRFATSWATRPENVEKLRELL